MVDNYIGININIKKKAASEVLNGWRTLEARLLGRLVLDYLIASFEFGRTEPYVEHGRCQCQGKGLRYAS